STRTSRTPGARAARTRASDSSAATLMSKSPAGHEDPHARVDAGGAHLEEHFPVADRRRVDLAELEDVG
ncbi:hypothetical protein AB0C29_42005, partial [Actinoplanes sp. NPDC048791]|uniref:hypothetical protein n=1 Tax=Actinoplanes sp. NPDC048791 TaxID=3154623 RepID=UPI0033C64C2C